jgi:hypothetical protein
LKGRDVPRPEPLRASSHRTGELARRMMAVEDRMQRTTDFVFTHLLLTARTHAQQLPDTWEAFGRVCQTRVGMAPEVLLDRPIAADCKAMVRRYPDVKPDEAKVDEYLDLISQGWDSHCGDE